MCLNLKKSNLSAFAWAAVAAAGLFLAPLRAVQPADPVPRAFVQTGHTSLVASVAFSPDGRLVLSGSADSTLKLWDVASGREIRTFPGHSGQVGAVAFSPDGRRALSGGEDKTLRLWDLATGACLKVFQGHTDWVDYVAFTPDGGHAVSSGRDRTLKRWDLTSGRVENVIAGHGDGVHCAALSPDGKRVVTTGGDQDWGLTVWDAASAREVQSLPGNKRSASALAFSPDGRQVLAGGGEVLNLWDVAGGAVVRSFPGHTGLIEAVAFSADGRRALSGAWDKTVKLWDVAGGRELRTFQTQDFVNSVAFSPDGQYVLAGTSDRLVTLWEAETGRVVWTFTGKALPVFAVAFSPDGRYTLSAGSDHTVKRWELSGDGGVTSLAGHGDQVFALDVSPDGRRALSASSDRTAKLWDVAAGRVLRTFQDSDWINAVAFSPDGGSALTGSHNGIMGLWDLATGLERRTFRGHTLGVDAVAFSPDGRYALSGSLDDTLKLWDLSTGMELRSFLGHTSFVESVAFSPDGRLALSGAQDRTMRLWDVATGSQLRIFSGHEGWVRSVAFSPDGRYVLSGSLDHTCKLWEVSTGRTVRTFRGQTSAVWCAAFGPGDKLVLVGSDDGGTTVYQAETGRELARMVSFPDGEWVVMTPEGYFNASANGARYLNVRTGTQVYGMDQFYPRFFRPEWVRLALAGKVLPGGETLADVATLKQAPTVRIMAPAPDAVAQGDTLDLVLRITDNGGGIGDISIYLNGSQVANDTRGLAVKAGEVSGGRTLAIPLTLVDGANEIKAVATNRDGSMESTPVSVTVTSRAVLARPDFYALVVGINEYRNTSITLNNAVADAAAFAEAVRGTAQPLFAHTQVQLLTRPDETSKEAIIRAFEGLRGKVKPNDVFVFYDASHGVVEVTGEDEQYFLLTSNVLLLSSRHLSTDALSQKELARLIGSIPAQKKVVFLDTCNAGRGGKDIQAALLLQARGLTDSTAVKVLQRAIGSAVFAASSDRQQALEGYHGHGLFTYVLLEGIRGKADVRKDGFITVLGLADYVEDEVVRLSDTVFKRQQSPTIETGANFPIGKVP